MHPINATLAAIESLDSSDYAETAREIGIYRINLEKLAPRYVSSPLQIPRITRVPH